MSIPLPNLKIKPAGIILSSEGDGIRRENCWKKKKEKEKKNWP